MHHKSDRAKGPFFALNCAALPKDILENELFGHEKGAFTGSTNEKAGAFEMASGGTIFLDEMAEMATDIQVKLLRALETRQIRRLGGKREINVDIRVVAATNKNLQKAHRRRRAARGSLLPARRGRDLPAAAARARRTTSSCSRTSSSRRFCAAERQEDHRLRGRRLGVDPELPLAGQRARAEERGRARGDHGAGARRSVRTTSSRATCGAAAEMPAALTIPVGATAAEARRQLVLRTFASTAGDAARTGKVLGLSERGRACRAAHAVRTARADASPAPAPADNGAELAAPRAARRQEPVATPARAASKKPSSKKGR